MALESMHGISKNNFRSGGFNHGLTGEDEGLDINQELISSFPNTVDPMSILAPPFVSLFSLDFIVFWGPMAFLRNYCIT